jgi:hypothetical protein
VHGPRRLAHGPGSGTVERVFRFTTALALALALAGVRSAQAEPRAGGPGSETCAARHGTALGQIACELARGLPTSTDASLVVVTAFSGELAGERRSELSGRLAALLAGELGVRARALAGIVGLPVAQRHARTTRVVGITIAFDRTRLSATADVLSPPGRFWERFNEQPNRVLSHAFATRALDAELRSYLPKVPLVVSKLHKLSLDEPAVALACGDLDADGSPELAIVSRQRARIGRVVSGAFRATKSADWSELSQLSPAPLREPIATAAVSSDGRLLLGISDRASGVELDADLRVLSRYAGRMPWGTSGCAARAGLGLAAERVVCAGAAKKPTAETETIDAIASAQTMARDGSPLEVWAARKQSDARVRIDLGKRRLELAEAVGAQLALGDLDGDGRLELMTTEPDADPARDLLLVRTLLEDGSTLPALRVAVPTGIQALAVCPPGANGFSTLVAATGDGLWILE